MSTAVSAPRVSLIVCTRNRASRLPEFLRRAEMLTPPAGGWEMVLVDNGSNDSTAEIIKSFARRAPFPVRYVWEQVPGLARARNAGMSVAAGELLVFTDDDCYPQPEYLCNVVDVFAEGRPGFVGGRVLLHDPTDARVTVRDNPAPRSIGPRTFVRPGVIHGANMAVSRDVVRAIGGFDPHLGAGTVCVAGEDADYLARAAWAGWSGKYDPRPTVWHHHGRKPGADARRQSAGYDYGRGAYYVKFAFGHAAWRVYLTHWCRSIWRDAKQGRFDRTRREIVGAVRYLRIRAAHPERVPRFDGAGTGRPSPSTYGEESRGAEPAGGSTCL